MKNINEALDFVSSHITRIEASRRGGGMIVDVSELFPNHDEAHIAIGQNYLGGGMLGSISKSADFVPSDDERELYDLILEASARYYHHVTNAEVEDYDEWSAADFESIQHRPYSAF